jgi:hypothetical protein
MKVLLIVIIPVLAALSLVYTPGFWVHLCLLIDFYTPWSLYNSYLFDVYHNFLIDRLEIRPELPIPELSPDQATPKAVREISKGFTFPFVIRGLLENSTALQTWKDPKFWLDSYKDEPVLCGTFTQVVENCTIGTFFDHINQGKPFYVSGASHITSRNPELFESIDSEILRNLEPGDARPCSDLELLYFVMTDFDK